ncbi:hypothetical protein GQ600_25698 [Phytophthora cactorum]|nr:hypothetical protein GQ600_25698 [Phytophthora cactorum]
MDAKTDFSAGWKLLDGKYKVLQQFCGVLTAAFPNTATVESDFSFIGWERNEYRRSLTNFSLEGILHAKQLDTVSQFATEQILQVKVLFEANMSIYIYIYTIFTMCHTFPHRPTSYTTFRINYIACDLHWNTYFLFP